jgi:hypothetical protein
MYLTINNAEQMLLLSAIEDLLTNETNRIPKHGICDSLAVITSVPYMKIRGYVMTHSQTWEYYSGNVIYPIPGGKLAYTTAYLWTGQQLIYRLDLLRYLKRQLLIDLINSEEN